MRVNEYNSQNIFIKNYFASIGVERYFLPKKSLVNIKEMIIEAEEIIPKAGNALWAISFPPPSAAAANPI